MPPMPTPTPTQPDTSDGSVIPENTIVISGMAGLYPKSLSVKDLSEILYNKVNPIEKTERWNTNMPEISHYIGEIPNLAYFDAQFFKVHYRLANLMDVMSRKLLEQTYQALFDAGQSPEELSGKKIGVFVGNCISESEKTIFYVIKSKSGLGMAGCSRSMFANRISYYLNLKGPSVSIDQSCGTSIAALEMAYDAIARGECESAIVGGSHLCFHPQTVLHYGRALDISKDGTTKSFDANADGCSKSEAINVFYLQKAKDAKRIYAQVIKAKSEFVCLPVNDGGNGGFDPTNFDATNFLQNFYKEANVSPTEVQYVEAFGAASRVSDKVELDTIDNFFCKGRTNPLMVGSVTSNIGYMEAASGISAITKVLLGYHFGKLAGNLHYKTPRNDIAAIREGRIEILADHKDIVPTYYTAVNGLSIGGNASHVLLQGYNKQKDANRYKSSFPRIVLCSGRQESSVQKIFEDLKNRPIDPEEHALLHNFHKLNISGHLARGFIILDTNKYNETVTLSEDCDYFDQGKRPLWFVYSGMGSQWTGMGKDLMRIPVFAAAINRCQRALEPKGLNLIEIITSDDKKIFDNILHSFVGINAIQIGLTDVLRALDIIPDNIIGHSVGEMACAYADGCLTTEETILCAYSRGLVSVQTPFIRGSMAAVGLGYKEISKMLPPEIEVACHNSAESCTISGPAEIMSEFVNSLTSKKIFAKEVPCSNIAYHSSYIADAGPGLLKYMKEIIKTPQMRSPKWLSTSIPRERWDEPLALYSSAEYHTNNLLNPVLFEETSQLIPPDAVLIEVAPHGLLQAILKRALPQSCKLISLTRRAHPENSRHLLEAIGKLYMEGFLPKVEALYPKVEFPVSISTPMLSHLVDWMYQEEWILPIQKAITTRTAAESQHIISTYDAEHSYLKGHVLRGKNCYPFSAALVAVWDTLTMSLNLTPKNLSVQFQNVFFYSQPILNKKRLLRISVALNKGNGKFEVSNENSLMMNGIISCDIEDKNVVEYTSTNEKRIMSEDIYQLLYTKEYQYNYDFCSIHRVSENLKEAEIEWKDNNWVTFLDGIIQLNILGRKHRTVSKLQVIRSIVIDVDKQISSTFINDNKVLVNAHLQELYDVTVCGGVIMEGMKFVDLPVLKNNNIELKMYEFSPLSTNKKISETKAFHMFLQIVADNISTKKQINIVQIYNTNSLKSEFRSNIEELIHTIPGITANYCKINADDNFENDFQSVDLLLTVNLFTNNKMCQKLKNVLLRDIFIINKHDKVQKETSFYDVVSSHVVDNTKIDLGIWRSTQPNPFNTLVLRTPQDYTSQDTLGGEYYLPLEYDSDSEQNATLKIAQIGNLNTLYWVNEGLHSHEGVEVKVNYVGANIVYINKLLGTQFREDSEPTKSVIDFSGVTKSGTSVMGLVHSDEISSRVYANPDLLLPVPEHWTLEDAATVPLAYTMAFYVLFVKVHVTSKHTICIQGAAGAFGQAVISVALAHGVKVFATVSSNAKKQLLKKLFPELKDDYIVDHSRDINFAHNILRATNGKGCDLLISCATDELKNFSFRCIGSYGVMIDTNVVPNRENYNFGMDFLSLDRVYYPIDISTIFQPKFAEDIKQIRLLMIDGIRHGYVRPLTRVTYEAQEASRAFHFHAAGKNRGRVLLDLQKLSSDIVPSITCSSSSWQLLISDDGNLALKLAERLVSRGAKNIVLMLDKVPNHVYVQKRLWEEDDITVRIIKTASKTTNNSDFIKDCNENGLLESIFVITSMEKAINVTDIVNNFSSYISTSGNSIKYFALVTTRDVDIKPTSWFGINEYSKMITKIKLPKIDLIHNDDKMISKQDVSINNAIDALEQALCSQKKTILVHTPPVPRKTLLDEIILLADIKPESKLKNASLVFTLQELNMDSSKLLAIQGFLQDVYEVNLNMKDLQKLSVKSIHELENRCNEFDFEENQGIASYFPELHSDELLFTTDIVFMPTLASSDAFNNVNFMNTAFLCVVPGLEGYYKRFTELCERLKLPAVVLQPGLDHPEETISELANRYINVLKKKASLNNNFYLLGYESGVSVALEMAAILETNGLSGTVFCIGGTPTEIFKDFRNNLKDYKTNEELQMGVLKHAYSLITAEDTSVLDELCMNLDWHQKLDFFMDIIKGKLSQSMQYTRKWIDYIYTKFLTMLENPCITKKISSQIICLRPQYFTSMDMSLQNYSHKKVITHQLESPLSLAHQDMMVATITNSHLNSDILEIFSQRNICNSYVVNTNETLN